MVSPQADRSKPQVLRGQSYIKPATIHVFVPAAPGIKRVRFYLDDPTRSGPPRVVENLKPYDFNVTADDGRARPFDISGLSRGSHTITAAVTQADGSVRVVSSTFRVLVPELVFQDDFSGRQLNEAWVRYDSPGHAGNGLRRPSAISVDGHGNLVITAQSDLMGRIVSGGMAHKKNLTYGRFEFRVRTEPDQTRTMSGVVLTWPQSQNWPVDGENNIYETGTEVDRTPFYSFVHYDRTNKQYSFTHKADGREWHTMAMEWGPSEIRIYRDGALVWVLNDTAAIPDVAHHLCIQLDAKRSGLLLLPVRMYVDFVRVYEVR